MEFRTQSLSTVFFKLVFVSLLIAFGFSSCATGFYTKRPIYKSDRVYVFTLNDENYPNDEEIRQTMSKPQPMPVNSAQSFLNLLSYLRVEKKGLLGSTNSPVYYPNQLQQITPVINDILSVPLQDTRYLLVTRYDPFDTVLSKMQRNTLLFWSDGQSIHLLFGEIQTELFGNDFIDDESWIDVYPVNLRRAPSDTKLVADSHFSFEKVGDFTHLTHISIPISEYLTLGVNPNFANVKQLTNRDNQVDSLNQKKESVPNRLKRLQELKDTNLISEDEYLLQRKRILSEL
ncbi:MAG: SHOCT domain-containing protein [Leptonema sp. (in: Bacteria)]|nr:SHOCT domain-containing protein [Leptonema sp. (in: bacteria)]